MAKTQGGTLKFLVGCVGWGLSFFRLKQAVTGIGGTLRIFWWVGVCRALFQTQIYDFSYGLNTIINIAVIELY